MQLMKSRSLVSLLLISQWLKTSQHAASPASASTPKAPWKWFTGGNLSTSQIQNMTTGDGSTTAMNNQMWSYQDKYRSFFAGVRQTGLRTATGSGWLKEELCHQGFLPLSCHQALKPDRTSCVSRRSSIVSESIQNLSKEKLRAKNKIYR